MVLRQYRYCRMGLAGHVCATSQLFCCSFPMKILKSLTRSLRLLWLVTIAAYIALLLNAFNEMRICLPVTASQATLYRGLLLLMSSICTNQLHASIFFENLEKKKVAAIYWRASNEDKRED